MADSLTEISFDVGNFDAVLRKWKVCPGSKISQGTVLLLYDEDKTDGGGCNYTKCKKFKSNLVGTVRQLRRNEGDLLDKGCIVLSVEGCSHPVVMKDMCAECGADLREFDVKEQQKQGGASVAMVHSIPELVVSQEQAQILGKADESRLLQSKKLVLLVDLDQTLVHTTNDDVPPNLKDVYHFQLHGLHSAWYHARLRPSTRKFLQEISPLYEMHICTFGARLYAHTIAGLLDKDGRYFSHRILSRDECFSANSKTPNLKALFPCGDHLVCIIDDRSDVWNYAPNLVQVKPYHFFQHTGDINAPPGLTKTEADSNEERPFVPTVVKRAIRKKRHCDKPHAAETPAEVPLQEDNEDKADSSVAHGGDNSTLQPEEIASSGNSSDASLQKSDSVENGQPNPAEQTEIVKEEQITSTGADSDSSSTPVTNGKKNVAADDQQALDEDKDNDAVEENEEVDVEDSDDYLLYLTDILKRIHRAYYGSYDEGVKSGNAIIPDIKVVIPQVRRQVLKGVNLVFSSVVPTNLPMEKSRAYHVAKSLGAEIQSQLVPPSRTKGNNGSATTHLVAARLGTMKVNDARKMRGIYIVTPDWLWCCAERWEKVEEKLFVLTKDTAATDKRSALFAEQHLRVKVLFDDVSASNRKQKSDTEQLKVVPQVFPTYDPVTGKRVNRVGIPPSSFRENGDRELTTASGSAETSGSAIAESDTPEKFAASFNPLLTFSSEEIASMDKEVEDILDDDDDDDSESEDKASKRKCTKRQADEESTSSSSSNYSLSGESAPHGWDGESSRKKRKVEEEADELAKSLYERPFYPRSELPHDSDKSSISGSESNESVGSVDEEMAAAVEREFLGI